MRVASGSLYQLVGKELCPSVGVLFQRVTQGTVPFPTNHLSQDFDGVRVEVSRGPRKRTRLELSSGGTKVVFRQSRHLKEARVMERTLRGGRLAVAVSPDREGVSAFSLMAEIDPDISFHLMPKLPMADIAFQITDDPGDREVDFMTAREASGFHATGLRQGHIVVCALTEGMRHLLRPAGLDQATEIQVHGFFTTSLATLARKVKLAFAQDGRVFREFPSPDALPPFLRT